jgi:prolyl oligopeptidase
MPPTLRFATLGMALFMVATAALSAPKDVVQLPPSASPPVSPAITGMPPLPLQYPTTRTQDLIEQKFGVAVPDPYRWLENDVRVDGEVEAWVKRENAVTDSYLATLPARDIFTQRIAKLFDYGRFSTPRKAGERYF